ncbi:MAG: TetR/AcrR family transcriptional regulator [Oscillospiraceae bacterium]|nr:TetR/AcrR family transcriptional regulator [Oscillospiraceae bacterium]
MPPKTKITKEMILDAAFEITRRDGISNVSARTISKQLDCSTQPIMYNYPSIASVRRDVHLKADEFHMQYIMKPSGRFGQPLVEIAVSYVRFAYEEPNLFKFLFQTGRFSAQSVEELINEEAFKPVLENLAATLNSDVKYAKEYFFAKYLMIHGLASLVADKAVDYNESFVTKLLVPENRRRTN